MAQNGFFGFGTSGTIKGRLNMSKDSFSHFDGSGATHMVKIVEKQASHRRAVARGTVAMKAATREAIVSGKASRKGDVIEVARLAGIMASKQTSNLIPLCHQVPLESVELMCGWNGEGEMEWTASVEATWKTGVEMEAMVAVSVATLTVYDMCKAIDRSMEVRNIGLLEKSGGQSGTFVRPDVNAK